MFNFIKNYRLAWLNYSYESIIIYFVLITISYYEEQAPLFIPFLITYVVGTLPMAWIIYRNNGKVSLLNMFVSVPVILLVSFLFGFSIFISLFILIVSIWRFPIHMNERKIENLENQIFISILILPLCLFLNADFTIEFLFYLFFIQIICLPLIKRENIRVDEGTKRNYLWVFLSLVSLCILIVISVMLIFPLLLRAFLYLSSFILIHVIGRFLAWLLSIIPENERVKELFSTTQGDLSEEPMPLITQETVEYFPVLEIIGYTLTAVIIGFVGSYLYKWLKKIKISPQLPNYIVPVDSYEREGAESLDDIEYQYSSHNNKMIRKKIDRLEHAMAKQGKGRKPFETIDSWLLRLGVNESQSIQMIEVYKQIRYGNKEVSKQDKHTFLQNLKELKGNLKK
ncbi:hypothetical protein [Chengkuizengella axinellae]|uniref:DUF4129 domain-containing protein n=1 Tax=Chengkuizengella axinellae TaxID=3064388 RepID=A0ABT9IY32_9BACL|nr:hypothetical protein [Chengkuizengella sp. 2205SS18-9]MDP5274153.1 hypothetical protein [Chengkuizengella sp. 2205SS18-9]